MSWAYPWTWFQILSLNCILIIPLVLYVGVAVFFNHRRGCWRLPVRCAPRDSIATILRRGVRIELGRPMSAADLFKSVSEQEELPERGGLRIIGPNTNITEACIRRCYQPGENLPDGSGSLAETAILVLRLSCLLAANGNSTVDVEAYVAAVLEALSLDRAVVEVGHRFVTAQLDPSGPIHYVGCGMDFSLSAMGDISSVAKVIAVQRPPIRNCLYVLDQVEERKEPFGRLVKMFALEMVCTVAPFSVYGGDYESMLGGAVLALFVMAALLLIWVLDRPHLEVPVVSFTVGVFTPLLWRIANSWVVMEQCKASYIMFGTLIIWLPGAQLIYGVHELRLGAVTNGATRLTKGLVNAILISIFLTFGWQFLGRNWETEATFEGERTNLYGKEGPISSLPPSITCASTDATDNWLLASAGMTIPLQCFALIFYQIRLRDWPGPFLVGWSTYAVQGLLGSWCSPSTCSLPGYVQTLLVAIWASSAACFFELTTDAPLWSSLIPVILILAPGAGAVKAVLGSFHRSEGDGESSTYTLWESLVLEGATYAAGFLIAMEFWLPLLAIKHDVHSYSRGHRGKLGRKSEWISNIIGYQRPRYSTMTTTRSVAVQA